MTARKLTMSDQVINVKVQLPAVIIKKEKWFTANCPILDVISQGETEEKAKANLSEALALFLISCFERGTLDAVLKSCGFKPIHNLPAPEAKQDESDYVDVPLPFMVDMGDPHRCHA